MLSPPDMTSTSFLVDAVGIGKGFCTVGVAAEACGALLPDGVEAQPDSRATPSRAIKASVFIVFSPSCFGMCSGHRFNAFGTMAHGNSLG